MVDLLFVVVEIDGTGIVIPIHLKGAVLVSKLLGELCHINYCAVFTKCYSLLVTFRMICQD